MSNNSPLEYALVGLKWDGYQYSKDFYFDMDISAFMLDKNDKLINQSDFVFYNNPRSRNDAVVHSGDNRSSGDINVNETISIDFSKIPDEITKVAVCVSIYDSEVRHVNFGQFYDAYVRIVQLASKSDKEGTPVLLFDLGNEFSIESALVVAEFRKNNGRWGCTAVSRSVRGGLEGICRLFGADV